MHKRGYCRHAVSVGMSVCLSCIYVKLHYMITVTLGIRTMPLCGAGVPVLIAEAEVKLQ